MYLLTIEYRDGSVVHFDRTETELLAELVARLADDREHGNVESWTIHPPARDDEDDALDVWLRIPEGEEESEAEANTFESETGYRVEWYLTAVGLVKDVEFDTLTDAHDWLRREGFADFTS